MKLIVALLKKPLPTNTCKKKLNKKNLFSLKSNRRFFASIAFCSSLPTALRAPAFSPPNNATSSISANASPGKYDNVVRHFNFSFPWRIYHFSLCNCPSTHFWNFLKFKRQLKQLLSGFLTIPYLAILEDIWLKPTAPSDDELFLYLNPPKVWTLSPPSSRKFFKIFTTKVTGVSVHSFDGLWCNGT